MGVAVRRARGLTRSVLLVGRWAVKVPSLRSHGAGLRGVLWSLCRGLSANLSELEWSECRGVCPVRWTLAGLINVYPRCAVLTEAEFAALDLESVGFLGCADKKASNMGWWNGAAVWIDFDQSWNDRPPCVHLGKG